MSEPLTREAFRAAVDAMIETDNRMRAERAERIQQVNTNPHRSSLGRTLDAVYIHSGPLFMSPAVAERFHELLAEAEADEATDPP